MSATKGFSFHITDEAAVRVRAFLLERDSMMRGLDPEHITAANWAPLLTSDLLALVDLDARDARVRADAWDEGYAASASDARWVEGTPNPYRLHDLDDVAAEFGVDLNDNEESTR